MSLLTDFRDNVSGLALSDWGESITYLFLDGSSREITAQVDRQEKPTEERASHAVSVYTAQVICKNHATEGVTDPKRGDGFTDSEGVTWDFQQIVSGNCGMWVLEFKSGAIHQTGRPSQADV